MNCRQDLVAGVRPAGLAAQADVHVDEPSKVEPVSKGGWQEEPASATRWSSSKAVSTRSRLCDDRIYQVLLG